MEKNKANEEDKLFHIDKTLNKKSLKVEDRIQNRTNQFLNNQDADGLKNNRSDLNEASRKEIKNNKFAKNRNYEGNDQSETGKIKIASTENTEHTISQAQSLWEEEMTIMDYYEILKNTKFELSDFPLLQELINSDKDRNILLAVVGLGKLITLADNPPIQNVIDTDVLSQLITLVGRNDIPNIQFEALWCLTNIASGKTEHMQALVDKGIIPIFTSFLGTIQKNELGQEIFHCPHPMNIVENSTWALGNISSENSRYRAMILDEKALKLLANILKNAEPNSMMTRNCMWCIKHLLRNRPFPSIEELLYIIPILNECLKSNDKDEIIIDCAGAISYISNAGEQTINKFFELGIMNTLNLHLNSSNAKIILPLVSALGNFMTGGDEKIQTVINAGMLPRLHALLSHPNKVIVKVVCWTISNICAGTISQVSELIELGVIDKMIDLADDDDQNIQREAGWAISNATALRDPDIVSEIVKSKGIEALCYLLKSKIDICSKCILLEGIRNCLDAGQLNLINEGEDDQFALIVENCGGLDTIESFYTHEDNKLYKLSEEIIDSYFLEEVSLDEEEDTIQQFYFITIN
ncbi:unnamed protein product [Moneuplotes crassus]|uniref:Importin subunit alpha n=1 Tax=Euplotes crassus TaxID=5936 RepID=A0AAD1X543_EUPCR|nr:unnamed protein product [Moneuplotes crassus]